MSEYTLLVRLQTQVELFQGNRRDPVVLFRQHFILFHCLYRLQQALVESGQAGLDINPLQIRLTPLPRPAHDQQLAAPDPLRRYYLDLTHLYQTGKNEVDTLLRDFWSRLAGDDQRREALAVLGLSEPVTDHEIRRRYRELVMRHHPDRGGDTGQLQLLNAAIATLAPGKNALANN